MTVSIPIANRVAIKYVVNGDTVSIISNGRVQKIDQKEKQRVLSEAVIFPELEYGQKGYQTALLGMQMTNGQQLYVVQVTSPSGEISKEYYDVASGLKTKQEVLGDKSVLITEYSNYKLVNGIKIPYTQTSNSFGQSIEMKLKEVKVNGGIDDSDFK